MSSEPSTHDVFCSVVIPVFNSAQTLRPLCQGITRVFRDLGQSYEIILVDDASKDGSWQVMTDLHDSDAHIKIIQFLRNYGQHHATICGLNHAHGTFVLTMDDDLQHDPADIPALLDKIDEGYDVVIAAFEAKRDTLLKRVASRLIRHLTTWILDKPRDLKLSSFRIMTRQIAQTLGAMTSPYPYIFAMLFSLTNHVANVPTKHVERKHGKSNYSFFKLLKLSFNLILNYSSLPIVLLSSIGIIVSLISFGMGVYFILLRLFNDNIMPGWTSVVVLLSFFNGLLLIILSFMGEYLRRIINELSVQRRYVIRHKRL